MPRVVVVGSFNVDHVWRVAALPQPGATLGGDYASGPGGKGFNQAMAARRAGAQTSFVCALGGDLGAQLARAKRRVMLYLHGGLNDEDAAATSARNSRVRCARPTASTCAMPKAAHPPAPPASTSMPPAATAS